MMWPEFPACSLDWVGNGARWLWRSSRTVFALGELIEVGFSSGDRL